MKVSFFSNYLTHHQFPFCLEMIKIFGDDFKFIATQKIEEERVAFGYEDMNNNKFVIRAYENEREAYKLGYESDIVIIGSAPTKYIYKRIINNKLTFRYSERIFKNNFTIKSIKSYCSLLLKKSLFEKNVYLLCSSAFSCRDYNIALSYIGRCIKWGYFTELKEYESIDKLIDKKINNSILWAGRFLKWKHPELVIELANYLKNNNIDFKIQMIGDGELYPFIKECINKYELNDNVELLGSMSPDKVRKFMEKSQIYLFTSDKGEGWGAVLNEAMNSGCSVISNSMIGAAPFLINDSINGLLYLDKEDLFKKVDLLINDKKKIKNMGIEAYKTIKDKWNAKVAAERIVNISNLILNGKDIKNEYVDGPCSKASFLRNGWYERK